MTIYTERRYGLVATRLATAYGVLSYIPCIDRLSVFLCDFIKALGSTWKPARKLQESVCAALGKPFMY